MCKYQKKLISGVLMLSNPHMWRIKLRIQNPWQKNRQSQKINLADSVDVRVGKMLNLAFQMPRIDKKTEI